MEKELEVEYKSLIGKKKYEELLVVINELAEKQDSYAQTNYFFDTKKFLLDKEGITLRLRHKKGNWQLTAKVKTKKEQKENKEASQSMEFNEMITEKEADFYLTYGLSAENCPLIAQMLEENGLVELMENEFHYIGQLTTYRTDYSYFEDTISLDQNIYGTKEIEVIDYEFEMESTEEKRVYALNETLKLTFGNGKGKRKRFIQLLKSTS